MSDKFILRQSAILNAVKNFLDSVILKYRKSPTSEYHLQLYTEARQLATRIGSSENTLDGFEQYVKKVVSGVSEYREEILAKFCETLTHEIIEHNRQKALKAGETLIYLTDLEEDEDTPRKLNWEHINTRTIGVHHGENIRL